MKPETLETERRVLDLLLDGAGTSEIMKATGKARRTIELHRARINKRYGAKSHIHLGRLVTEERMRRIDD